MERELDRVQLRLDTKISQKTGLEIGRRLDLRVLDLRHPAFGFFKTLGHLGSPSFSKDHLVLSPNGTVLDGMLKLKRGHLLILPPVSDLIEVEIKSEGGRHAGLDRLLHFFCEAMVDAETDLPVPRDPFHLDLLDRGLLRKGLDRKTQEEETDDASRHPLISDPTLHESKLKFPPKLWRLCRNRGI